MATDCRVSCYLPFTTCLAGDAFPFHLPPPTLNCFLPSFSSLPESIQSSSLLLFPHLLSGNPNIRTQRRGNKDGIETLQGFPGRDCFNKLTLYSRSLALLQVWFVAGHEPLASLSLLFSELSLSTSLVPLNAPQPPQPPLGSCNFFRLAPIKELHFLRRLKKNRQEMDIGFVTVK